MQQKSNKIIYDSFFSFPTGLKDKSGSRLIKDDSDNLVKVKGRHIKWPWKIVCGHCQTKVQLRFDGISDGRIKYFEKSKYYVSYISTKSLAPVSLACFRD